LRNLLFRTTEFTKQLMVGIIWGEYQPENQDKLIKFLLKEFSDITTLVSILNTKKNDSYNDLTWQTHYGEGYIYEILGNKTFRISPLTFFQTNTLQALKLYQTIYSWIPENVEIIYDLYAGCGSIGIFISEKAKKIIGIEYVPSAVVDAENNLKINQLKHLKYFAGDISKILTTEFVKEHGKPEVIITDPPRAGMEEKVVRRLLQIEGPQIIYVSCNPATQAHHVENLALLKLKK